MNKTQRYPGKMHRDGSSGFIPAKFQRPFFAPVVQPKLRVNAPDDTYEKEADSVADSVMRMPDTPVQRQEEEEEELVQMKEFTPAIRRKCDACEAEESLQRQPMEEEDEGVMLKQQSATIQRKCAECEEGEQLQRKSLAGAITPLIQRKKTAGKAVDEQTATSLESGKSGGQSLPDDTRGWMESRFGTDFSNVKVHTDAHAVQLNRELNAQAFTHGSHIYFNEGKFAPGSDEGKQLLAHELTHTIQQQGMTRSMSADRFTPDAPESTLQRETADTSEAVLSAANNGDSGSHGTLRASSQLIMRADPDAVGFTIRQGFAQRTGIQFWPPNLTDTFVGPVMVRGGLLSSLASRLNVIIGENMTLRRLARILLPLWTTATPFTPPGATAPLPLDIINEEELAQGLLVYNQTYLPAATMANWRTGLRFPLPIRLDELTGIGTLHPLQIRRLASGFEAVWAPLLDQAATGLGAAPAATLQTDVAAFLARETTALARGIHLGARAVTNAMAELPFIREVFSQLNTGAFEVALAFMDNLVNNEISLLASQRDGNAILTEIRTALGAAPATPDASRQRRLTRANLMLGLVTPPQALAPPASARNRAEKTITVDTLQLNGSTRNIATDIAVANAILSQCNIRVVHGVNAPPPQPPLTTTTGLLGGDTDLRAAITCASPSAEERRLFRVGSAEAGFGARFRAFYVATFSGVNAAAYSCPPATSPHPLLRNTIVIQNSADTATLAHELGHILINLIPHTPAPALMDPTPSGANTQIPQISNAHCTRLYNRA